MVYAYTTPEHAHCTHTVRLSLARVRTFVLNIPNRQQFSLAGNIEMSLHSVDFIKNVAEVQITIKTKANSHTVESFHWHRQLLCILDIPQHLTVDGSSPVDVQFVEGLSNETAI